MENRVDTELEQVTREFLPRLEQVQTNSGNVGQEYTTTVTATSYGPSSIDRPVCCQFRVVVTVEI